MDERGTRTGIELPGNDTPNVPHRQLCLKRDPQGHFCLHDAVTGMPLDGQTCVVVEQRPFDATKVIVTFTCDPRADGHVILIGDDRG